jgi:hypothetical protein
MFSSSLPKTILRLLAVLILLGLAAWSFWQYQQTKKQLDELTKTPSASEQALQERQELIAKVSRLMVLPASENPLILNIENAAALAKTQPFFQNASDGDIVLIYTQAGKSIIYSPERNIIVNVGTLTVQNMEPVTATESSLN